MNAVFTGVAAMLAAAAISGPGPQPLERPQAQPIERWLVARTPAPDSLDAAAALETDFLASPGEAGVLPDRGRPAAGLTWHLVRRDGAAGGPADSILAGVEPGTVVYAHSYVRLPADRTLRLEWSGPDCTEGRAWVNGRALERRSADVRLGAGWNTLLLKLVAGDCPFGYRATLAATGPSAGVPDVRVQASRPYGDVRTGPEDWVVAADTARVGDERRWREDRLYAGLVVGLTAWGRAPVSGVSLELRGGAEGRAAAPWLVPGDRSEVVIPVRLDRLPRLLSAGSAELRLRWHDEEVNRRLVVVGTPPGPSERVALDGWEIVQNPGPGDDGGAGGRLPNGAGWALRGEWEVPEALAGRRLVLRTEDAPADYALNGSRVRAVDGGVTLCAPCARGVEIRLSATSTAPWTGWPSALVSPGRDDR